MSATKPGVRGERERMEPHDELTALLTLASKGDPRAAAQVTPLIYQELHRLACERAPKGLGWDSVSPTALVHEACLRMMGGEMSTQWASRRHFFAVSALIMRRLVQEAIQRRRQDADQAADVRPATAVADCGGDAPALRFDPIEVAAALEQLAAVHPRQAQIAEWKVYVGLTSEEIGTLLEIPAQTVEVEWAHARGFLLLQLKERPAT